MAQVSQREFARMRGVNPGYVNKLKNRGLLVMVQQSDGSELVDVEASIARIEAARDPAKDYMREVNQAQRHVPRPPPQTTPNDEEPVAAPVSAGTSLYQKARTQSQVYDAKIREMDFQVRAGTLVRKEDVRRAVENLATIVSKGLNGIPARVMPLINGEPDAAKREQILERELRAVLTEFADAALAMSAPAQ